MHDCANDSRSPGVNEVDENAVPRRRESLDQRHRKKRHRSTASNTRASAVDLSKQKFYPLVDGRRTLIVSLRNAARPGVTANWSDVRHHYKKLSGRNLTTEELNRIAGVEGKTKVDLFTVELSDVLQIVEPHGQIVRPLTVVSPTKHSSECGGSTIHSPVSAVNTPPLHPLNSSNLTNSLSMVSDLSPIPAVYSAVSSEEDSFGSDGQCLMSFYPSNENGDGDRERTREILEVTERLASMGIGLAPSERYPATYVPHLLSDVVAESARTAVDQDAATKYNAECATHSYNAEGDFPPRKPPRLCVNEFESLGELSSDSALESISDSVETLVGPAFPLKRHAKVATGRTLPIVLSPQKEGNAEVDFAQVNGSSPNPGVVIGVEGYQFEGTKPTKNEPELDEEDVFNELKVLHEEKENNMKQIEQLKRITQELEEMAIKQAQENMRLIEERRKTEIEAQEAFVGLSHSEASLPGTQEYSVASTIDPKIAISSEPSSAGATNGSIETVVTVVEVPTIGGQFTVDPRPAFTSLSTSPVIESTAVPISQPICKRQPTWERNLVLTESTSSYDSGTRLVTETEEFLAQCAKKSDGDVSEGKEFNDDVFAENGVSSLSPVTEMPAADLVMDDGVAVPDLDNSRRATKARKQKAKYERRLVRVGNPNRRVFNCCTLL